MKTGDFERTYTTNETRYVVEGYSKQWNCFVYPYSNWSRTDWGKQIDHTFDSPEQASHDISNGYWFEMIEAHEIIDIKIYAVTTVTEHVERKRIVSYDMTGKPIDHVEPAYTTAVGEITARDIVVLGRKPNDRDGCVYGRVVSIRPGKMVVYAINGCYEFTIDTSTEPHWIHEESVGKVGRGTVFIIHIGRPDPAGDLDYNYQLNYLREHYAGQSSPTSSKLSIPHIDQVDENGESSAYDANDTFFNPPEEVF